MRALILQPRALAPMAMAFLIASATAAGAQTPGADEPSLYERLGGLEGIAVVVDDFMNVFVQDPLVMANPAVRERKTLDRLPYLNFQITTLVCEVTGGPCRYTGASLTDAHDGLNVSEAEWDRMGAVFGQTLARHGVPEAEQQELFAIIGGTKPEIVVADQ